MGGLLLGNMLSLAAALLLGLSCWSRVPRRVFACQVAQNLVLAASSLAFGSYSAAVSAALSASRCFVIVKGRYGRTAMLLYAAATAVLGILTNSKGLVGLLPVLATVQYTYCSYRFTGIRGIKWTLMVNLLLWEAYALAIWDFASAAAWAITLGVTAVSLFRLKKAPRRET